MNYHLAQINVARMKGSDMEDPIMRDFKDNLDKINEIADTSHGFVWRLQDESGNATDFAPANDPKLLINMSVWESIKELEDFTYRTHHLDILKRKNEWFTKFGKVAYALWWIGEGSIPTVEEGFSKLELLEKEGPTPYVFNFRSKFDPPA